jgi:FkbM family methyltransferase
MKINHFDIGLAHGQEIQYCYDIYNSLDIPFNIYGIEAENNSYNYCKKKYKNLKNTKIFNYAISSTDNKEIKIYLQDNEKSIKQGNSIYSTKNNVSNKNYQLVKSIKFSTFIKNNNINLDNSINIIRINIEGAEWDFFNDIINSNLVHKFKIYLGAGQQDIWKVKELVDSNKVELFNNLLIENKIKVFRYSFHYKNKNSILQKLLLDIDSNISNRINKDVQFINIEKDMVLNENTDFNFKWELSDKMYNNIEDNITLVLLRDNHEKVCYQYLYDICTVNKNIKNYEWNIKAGKKHNKDTQFIVVLMALDSYPNYIGWSKPFNII